MNTLGYRVQTKHSLTQELRVALFSIILAKKSALAKIDFWLGYMSYVFFVIAQSKGKSQIFILDRDFHPMQHCTSSFSLHLSSPLNYVISLLWKLTEKSHCCKICHKQYVRNMCNKTYYIAPVSVLVATHKSATS